MRVLITGATSGIGKALAIAMGSRGDEVLTTGRNIAGTEAFAADLSTREGQQRVVDVIWQEKPDILINNAGFALYGEAVSYPTAIALEQVEVNVQAPLHLTLEMAKMCLAENKEGTILNISSIAGDLSTPGAAIYGASKTCLTRLSETLDFEMTPQGVRVLAFCPGMVDTPFALRASQGRFFGKKRDVSVNAVVKKILNQLVTKKGVVRYDWKFRFAAWCGRLFPKKCSQEMIYTSIKRR